jgi:hypothetical protein
MEPRNLGRLRYPCPHLRKKLTHTQDGAHGNFLGAHAPSVPGFR